MTAGGDPPNIMKRGLAWAAEEDRRLQMREWYLQALAEGRHETAKRAYVSAARSAGNHKRGLLSALQEIYRRGVDER